MDQGTELDPDVGRSEAATKEDHCTANLLSIAAGGGARQRGNSRQETVKNSHNIALTTVDLLAEVAPAKVKISNE